MLADQCDYSHYAQSYVSQKLDIPGPSLDTAQASTNKLVQRSICNKAGITIPKYKLCLNYNDVVIGAEMLKYPLIIKPLDNRGSIGVTKVSSNSQLKHAYETALINSHSRLVLIEEFIHGPEYTVDGYCFSGQPRSLAIAVKKKIGVKSQVSTDIKYPGTTEACLAERLFSINENVAEVLNYSFGFIHSEYIVDDQNNIYLVEAANRGGGCFTSEIIVPAVTDINLVDLYIDDCLNIGNHQFQSPAKHQVMLKFFSLPPGKIKSIVGTTNILNNPNVLKFRLNVKVGDVIKEIQDDSQRHGFVIYTTDNNIRHEVEELINQLNVTIA